MYDTSFVYCRGLAHGTVSLRGDWARGDDKKTIQVVDISNSLLSLSILLALAINFLKINCSNSIPIGSLLDSASESDSKSNELKITIILACYMTSHLISYILFAYYMRFNVIRNIVLANYMTFYRFWPAPGAVLITYEEAVPLPEVSGVTVDG